MMFWLGVLAAYVVPAALLTAYLTWNQLRNAIDEGYIAITKHVGFIRADVFVKIADKIHVRHYLAITPRWRLLWAKRGRKRAKAVRP